MKYLAQRVYFLNANWFYILLSNDFFKQKGPDILWGL